MAFFSLIALLLLEQIVPLDHRRRVEAPLHRLAALLERHANAGERRHAIAAWMILALGLPLLALAVTLGLRALSPLLSGAWSFLLLYLALGFRELAHTFYDIQTALRMDDLPRAEAGVRRWRVLGSAPATSASLAAVVVEEALLRGHRRVFGVLACYLVLPGPAGVVLYRVAEALLTSWGRESAPAHAHFAAFSRQAFALIDWLPARLSAAVFSIVGDFESAVYCWRTQVPLQGLGNAPDEEGGVSRESAIVLASGAGALGLRLCDGRFGVGGLADADSLRRVSGLLSRAFIFWLLILMLLGVAQ